jgi:glutamine synthetase
VPEAADIARVLFSDLHGLTHGKYVAADDLDHPTHYAVTVLTQAIDGDMPPAPGYGADVGFPDMEGRADLATRRPGWEPDTDVVFADLFHTDGRELPIDVRRALRLVCQRWMARGLTPMAGFEMELYLLAKDPGEGLEVLGVPAHRVYGTGTGFDPTGIGREIFETCRRCGIPVQGVNGEFHPGQMEVALHYRDAMAAADDAFLFRDLARELAYRAGRGATFMPRPFADLVGTGLHVNLSLQDAQGSNALAAPDDEYGLTRLGRHALAGLIAHHEALCAIGAPTINSYKRLVPGLIAGYWANWGLDNRFSTYRVPGERGQATRIECRNPDGAASPHLVTAALLAAMLHGLEDELPLPEPQVGDADAEPNTDRHAPHSLAEALDAVEKDTVLTEALGADLMRTFVSVKRADVTRFNAAVTDWEIKEYARLF